MLPAAPHKKRSDGADDEGTVLSIRAEAQRTVAPDSVVLGGGITTWRVWKPEAVAAAAAALDHLTAELSALGGVPLTLNTKRSPLSWSAFSATTHAEREHDKETGRHELTARILSTVAVRVVARDFSLLEALGAVFTRHNDFNVHHLTWHVDDDNPGWLAVRGAPIQAVLRKGRDYADARGASLVRVEHVADTGLLGGSGEGNQRLVGRTYGAAAAGGPRRDVDTPTLDPVPQELTAVIEARFRATPAALPA